MTIVVAICPSARRPWVDAMLAELGVVRGRGERILWMLGILGVVAGAIREKVSTPIPVHLALTTTAALLAMVLSGLLWVRQYEGLGLDDDVFLGVAAVFATALIGTFTLLLLQQRHAPNPN